MALFKVFKGNAANLMQNKPNAVDGYCYFTIDDGKFYIDTATADNAVIGTNRIPLNAKFSDVASTGLMLPYTVCNTASALRFKEITIATEGWTQQVGSMIAVYFAHANSAENPNLSINGVNVPIYKCFGQAAGDTVAESWDAGSIIIFFYTEGSGGANPGWIMANWHNPQQTIDDAINALDVAQLNVGAGETIKTIKEVDGKIAVTAQDIEITKSQISDFPTSMPNPQKFTVNTFDGTTTYKVTDYDGSSAEQINFKTGTNNGTFAIDDGSSTTREVAIKGLKSAAYTEASAYATAAQGIKADDAMPKAGGQFTGDVTFATNKTLTLSGDPTNTNEAATKGYVDNQITQSFAANDAMVFKGVITSNTVWQGILNESYSAGWTYRVSSASGFVLNDENGVAKFYVEPGDLVICVVDKAGSTKDASQWIVAQANLDGAVISNLTAAGASTGVTSGAVSVFSGTSGNLITKAAAAGDQYTPIYLNSNGVPTAISEYHGTADMAKQTVGTLSVNGVTFDGSTDASVGTIGIGYGGTGATTAQDARGNLIGDSADIGSSTNPVYWNKTSKQFVAIDSYSGVADNAKKLVSVENSVATPLTVGSISLPVYFNNGVPVQITSYAGTADYAVQLSTSGTTKKFWRGDNTWSDTLTGPLYINDISDTSATATTGAIIIGDKTSNNIAITKNKIMSRNNSVAEVLHLNPDGGNVSIGAGGLTTTGTVTGNVLKISTLVAQTAPANIATINGNNEINYVSPSDLVDTLDGANRKWVRRAGDTMTGSLINGNLTIGGTADTDAGQTITSNGALYLKTSNDDSITFYTDATARASFDDSGNFIPEANNTYDIGLDDARWRSLNLQIQTLASDYGVRFYDTQGDLVSSIGSNGYGPGIYGSSKIVLCPSLSDTTYGFVVDGSGANNVVYPGASDVHDLGSTNYRWRAIYSVNMRAQDYYHVDADKVVNGSWTTGATGTAGDGEAVGTLGTSILTLGNATGQSASDGTGANNSKGFIRIYNEGTTYSETTSYDTRLYPSTGLAIPSANTSSSMIGILFRPEESSKYTHISYQTGGNEALVSATTNSATSFIFVNGESSSNISNSRWQSLTGATGAGNAPGLQIKNNCVSIGELIAQDVTPTYKLKVKGNEYVEFANTSCADRAFMLGTRSSFHLAAGTQGIQAYNNDNTSVLYLNNLGGGINAGDNLYPKTTNTYTLGTTTYRWKNVYIGTADTYGDAYTPVYWNDGVPTAVSIVQKVPFTINNGKKGVVLTHASFTVNSYVIQIIITSGESNLGAGITWTSAGTGSTAGTITLNTTVAVGGDVSGYILVIRGSDISDATSADVS